MGRRILGIAVLSTVLAVVLFGAPLAYVVRQLVVSDEHSELQRRALQAAVGVSPDFATSGDPVELVSASGADLSLYTPDGRRFAGSGPALADQAVRQALRGSSSIGDSGAELVAAVPVSANERVVAVVRAASPRSSVTIRVVEIWALMTVLALVAAGGALLLARRATKRLVRPVEALEHTAAALGGGNFAIRAGRSDIAEIDKAGAAMNRTAERLGDLVAHERAFTTHASHQLRTPLTALRLKLETALEEPEPQLRRAVADGVVAIDQLSRTIDDVLVAARPDARSATTLDLPALLGDVEARWAPLLSAAQRPLRVDVDAAPPTAARLPAVRQIVEILVDNAYRHGRGAVKLIAREASGALAIDIIDEGDGEAAQLSEPAGGHGHGLPMARQLAAAEGGRIVAASGTAGTRFTLLLPARAAADTG